MAVKLYFFPGHTAQLRQRREQWNRRAEKSINDDDKKTSRRLPMRAVHLDLKGAPPRLTFLQQLGRKSTFFRSGFLSLLDLNLSTRTHFPRYFRGYID